jgi:DNA polymerase (family 10)
LKAACEQKRVRTVKGFGPKTEQNLLEATTRAKKPRNEINIHKALRLAEDIVNYLGFAPAIKEIEIAGPLRRWHETTPDITIVASNSHPIKLLDYFAGFPLLIRVMQRSENSCMAILNTGIKVLLLVAQPHDFAAALLDATGSPTHLERLREIPGKTRLTITPHTGSARARQTRVKTEAEM